MIDRHAREQLVEALLSYMDEKLTAFALDERTSHLRADTEDRTVQYVAESLWFHYDDCRDHKIVATKAQWDYFWRLLLLLQSDVEIAFIRKRRWHLRQAAAAILLGGFGVLAARTGPDTSLFMVAAPFGVASMVIAWLNARQRESAPPIDITLTPFPSLVALRAIRRSVVGFAKRPYPWAIESRRIRSATLYWLAWVSAVLAWLMFSPLVLAFQILPEMSSKIEMSAPSTLMRHDGRA